MMNIFVIIVLFFEIGSLAFARSGNFDGGTYNPRNAWKLAHQRRRVLPDIDIKSHFESVETHIWEDIQNYHKSKSSEDRQGMLYESEPNLDYLNYIEESYSAHDKEENLIKKKNHHSPEYRESRIWPETSRNNIFTTSKKRLNSEEGYHPEESSRIRSQKSSSTIEDEPKALKYSAVGDGPDTLPWRDEAKFQKSYWNSFNTDIQENMKDKDQTDEKGYTPRIIVGEKRNTNARFQTALPTPTPADNSEWVFNTMSSENEKWPTLKEQKEVSRQKYSHLDEKEFDKNWKDEKYYKHDNVPRENKNEKLNEITERTKPIWRENKYDKKRHLVRGKKYPYETKIRPSSQFFNEFETDRSKDETISTENKDLTTTESIQVITERRKVIRRRKPDLPTNYVTRKPNNQLVLYKQDRPRNQGAEVKPYYHDGGNNSPGVNQVVQYVSNGPPHRSRKALVAHDRQLVQVRPANVSPLTRSSEVNASAVALLSFLLLLNMMQDVMERITGRK